MTDFRKKGDKTRRRYSFSSGECIGAECWAPAMYQHRGATMSGSRNTGSPDTPCCINRAYHGCPRTIVLSSELARKRKAEGWVRA